LFLKKKEKKKKRKKEKEKKRNLNNNILIEDFLCKIGESFRFHSKQKIHPKKDVEDQDHNKNKLKIYKWVICQELQQQLTFH